MSLAIERMRERGAVTPNVLRSRILKIALDETKEAISKEGQLSLASFIRMAWHVVEPVRPYVHGSE